MTMILDLPRDLVEEIFSRISLKSMRAVRLTCRKWDTLSKSRSFTKMRFDKEVSAAREGESRMMVVMMNNDLHLMSFFLEGDPSTEHKGKLSCLNGNKKIKISQVFHCEGLLLCILKDDSRFVVWNPYLRQTRWIKPRYFHRGHNGKYMDRYRYALGYVKNKKKKKSYKIWRFLDDRQIENIYAPGERFKWYEIYDFDSDLWTTLDVPLHWFITFHQRGVSLKGNTYFCATKDNLEDELDDHLICFDFESETFGPLLPFPFSAGKDDNVALSCVREEKLAVLLTHDESYELNIWITTKMESEKVLWSKFLTLDTEPEYPISSYGGFFIDERKKVVMGFDEEEDDWYHNNYHTVSIFGEAKYLRKMILRDKTTRRSTQLCSYVPSPEQIKQPARGKNERQSSLEKRRYDEK
ncbi:hypothetical protein EUTSA_v10022089mg, partial [Eutrema salsugineum]